MDTRNGEIYCGITCSIIFKIIDSVMDVYCSSEEKTIRNGMMESRIKNADWAE